jgi:hypothetical protein
MVESFQATRNQLISLPSSFCWVMAEVITIVSSLENAFKSKFLKNLELDPDF